MTLEIIFWTKFLVFSKVIFWCMEECIITKRHIFAVDQTGLFSFKILSGVCSSGMAYAWLNITLNSDRYVAVRRDHFHLFMDFLCLDIEELSHCYRVLVLFRICLISILVTSYKWWKHHNSLTWAQLNIDRTRSIDLLAWKIMHLQIPGNYGQLSRHMSSDNLWNRCCVKLVQVCQAKRSAKHY